MVYFILQLFFLSVQLICTLATAHSRRYRSDTPGGLKPSHHPVGVFNSLQTGVYVEESVATVSFGWLNFRYGDTC